MTTYNPFAFQGYEVKASKVQQSFHANRSDDAFVHAEQAIHIHKMNNTKLMKITKRKQLYKWMFCLMVIILFVTSFYLVRASAISTSSQSATIDEKMIIVGSGDTLWKLASLHYEHISDKGFAVYLIKERNGLKTDVIQPGEQLILPSY